MSSMGAFASVAVKVTTALLIASVLGGVAMFNAHGQDIADLKLKLNTSEVRYESTAATLQEIKRDVRDVKKLLEAR